MQYEEFQKLLHQWNITIVPKGSKRIRGHDVDTFRNLAKQTEKIDYDCIFYPDGCCNGRMRNPGGCCISSRCSVMIGYWRKEGDTLDEDTARKITEHYDPKNGFMTERVGCRLPRELRSPTCLFIRCSEAKLTDDDQILLAKIQYGAFMSR
jgi:hypothetical protein